MTGSAVRRYLFSVARSLSRLINASIGGWSGETLSGRAYRENITWLKYVLDKAWFLIDAEEHHCRDCYLLDKSHGDYPEQAVPAGLHLSTDDVSENKVWKDEDVKQ